MTDTNNSGGEKQSKRSKADEKVDINPEDLELENRSLHVRAEDLHNDSSVSNTQGGDQVAANRRRVQLVYCSKCGHGSQLGSRYCSHCGSKMSKIHSQQQGVQNTGTQRKISVRKILVIAIGIVLLLLIISGILYLTGVFANGEGSDFATIHVPGDFETIQEAINASEEGTEIEVAEGIYLENIDFKGKNLILRSVDPEDKSVVENTVVDGGKNGSVIRFTRGESSNAQLKGFKITGGSGSRDMLALEYGGDDNIAGYFGGGILVANNSSPHIENNIIVDNFADYGGGIAVYEANPLIIKNEIKSNHAQFYGGGLLVLKIDSLDLYANDIESNTAEQKGGAVWTDNPNLFLAYIENDDNTFYDNKPDDLGDYIREDED